MDELISRQAAIDAISYSEIAYYPGDYDSEVLRRDSVVKAAILSIVPIDAEPEIIRCKDCKHYVIHTLFGHRQGWCERLCDEYDKSLARGTEEDDFCSRAEERRR